jgi:hypothetical protein
VFNIYDFGVNSCKGVNLSKNLAAVHCNICVKYCKKLINFVFLCQFVY